MTRFHAIQRALRGAFLRRSLMVGAVVGTVLNAINQGDAVLSGGQVEWLKGMLTYCVPFSVSTFASWCAILERAAGDGGAVNSEPG